ncbi:NAD-dependent succinate-semialdehyde dehydrogenase [Dokdonia genika]|uniref:NAD-dependent succinate-semialdehyde dehydrogenase n=1 Tax=Dokdonia genika TaxID=308113 RepID=A0ABV9LBL4_9FLAO
MEREIKGGFRTINPHTEKEIATYTYFTESEVNDAIDNCHEAFLEWKEKSLDERATIIKNIGKELKNHKEQLVQLMTDEMGKVVTQGGSEIDLCIAITEYTAANAGKELEPIERELPNGGKGIITYSPEGVIYSIQPWNFPTYQPLRVVIANLMAGNGVLLKHAQNVTGSALLVEEVLRKAGVPEGLFKVLVIDHSQSNDVIKNDKVRGVTFTGSSAGGRKVAEKAGAAIKKTVLELGSNDAYLVLDDADIEKAVEACVQGRLINNGETCIAAKRFVVVDKVYDAFKEGFVQGMKDAVMGDPNNEETQLGPIAREDLRDLLADQVKESVAKGAVIEVGGEVPDNTGYYYPSTVLSNVEPGQPAYDDELFGPVASLIRAKDNEDAMRIANDSRFGLGGGIFSRDEKAAIELAQKHFDTGMVFVNSYGLAQPMMPFGGVKDSGYGREHGGFGLKEFVNAKSVMLVEES